MEDILTFCGVGILSVFAICVMREVRAELTVPTVLAVTVMFMCVLITRITSAVEFSSKYGAYIRTEYITYILRALGISYITSFSCEICRTLGEGAVASHLETVGRAEILVLMLPLFNEFLAVVLSV